METRGMKVLLVMLRKEDDEILEILASLRYEVVAEIVQVRRAPDPRFYVGSGKLEMVRRDVHKNAVDCVVVEGVLTPAQHHNLESFLKVDVKDRVWLVLELFERSATAFEAKMQVDLARMEYMAPFIREWVHREKRGEHPGFMAGGEYSMDDYLLFIKRKRAAILKKLKKSEERGTREKSRLKELGWMVVGIAGYTNAGKSSLHDALCGSSAVASPEMFTTLQPKTSSLKSGRAKVVFEDTIGFIEGLPPRVISGFRVTLDRLKRSDMVLLVIDGSDPFKDIERKVSVCLSILREHEIRNVLPVINKSDNVSGGRQGPVTELVKRLTSVEPVMVSAVKGYNVDVLVEEVVLRSNVLVHGELYVPKEIPERVLSHILSLMSMYRAERTEGGFLVTFFCRRHLKNKIMNILRQDVPLAPVEPPTF